MKYFDAISIYQDFCVSLEYAEITKRTREQALKETAAKYTFTQIADCFESLLNELDEKRGHYLSLFKIIATLKKANGEKIEGDKKERIK